MSILFFILGYFTTFLKQIFYFLLHCISKSCHYFCLMCANNLVKKGIGFSYQSSYNSHFIKNLWGSTQWWIQQPCNSSAAWKAKLNLTWSLAVVFKQRSQNQFKLSRKRFQCCTCWHCCTAWKLGIHIRLVISIWWQSFVMVVQMVCEFYWFSFLNKDTFGYKHNNVINIVQPDKIQSA